MYLAINIVVIITYYSVGLVTLWNYSSFIQIRIVFVGKNYSAIMCIELECTKLIKNIFLSKSHENYENLRLVVRKNQSHKEGVRTRGPRIWLIFIYIVQFFTLIIIVWFIFHKNGSGRNYVNFKFFRPTSGKHS